MLARRLGRDHEEALRELLERSPVVNLFLMSLADASPIERSWWYGIVDGDFVRAAIAVVPQRVAVPWAEDDAHAAALGALLRELHRPCMLVGPRAACDAIWATWAGNAPTKRSYNQRLYVLDRAPQDPGFTGLRCARAAEWRTIAKNAAAMEVEDLGVDPSATDMALHERVVRERIDAGRTWVIHDHDEIVFQINVGTDSKRVCQVGGTYIPPKFRGQGLASRAMAALGRLLLVDHQVVTLHVNEANLPAVRCYERAGFRPDVPFRLITGLADADSPPLHG